MRASTLYNALAALRQCQDLGSETLGLPLWSAVMSAKVDLQSELFVAQARHDWTAPVDFKDTPCAGDTSSPS